MSIMADKKTSRVKSHSGFTLLEVLIALLIFSIGLLGLAGLESQSLRFNHSAYLRTQASYMAYDILDRMRANRATALNNQYNASISSSGTDHSCDQAATTCTTSEMAQHDIYEWKQLLSQLPNGKGSVTRSGDVFSITVQWDDPITGALSNTSQFVMRSRL